jgi:hypothetical protein
MSTGTQNKIYTGKPPLHVRDAMLFERGNVSGFAHEGSEVNAAGVIGPNSTPGGSPNTPFVIGVFSAMSAAAQPGAIRAIDSELLFNYAGSTFVAVNPTSIDGQPTAANQNASPTSIASIRGAITIGGTYTGATAGTGTAGVDPSRTTATTITGGYLYGVQGKIIVRGTLATTSGEYSAALQGQLDLSAAVGVTSPLSALWLDMGATASAAIIAAATHVNVVNITNTTNALVHAIFGVTANAAFFMDLGDLAFGGQNWAVAKTAGANGAMALKVFVNGSTWYIPLSATAT